MSSSIREQIVDAIVAALAVPGGPAGLTVLRFAGFPVDYSKLPAVKVYWIDDPGAEWIPPRGSGPLLERKLQVVCECYAAGVAADGTASDTAIETLLVWVERQMFVDPTFGRLALFVTPIGAPVALVAEDRSYISVHPSYQVEYTHRPGDLTTRA